MKKQGFTLFELLVSISIIAILVAIASMSYSSVQKKARDSRRIQDINSIQKAAEQFYAQNASSYPISTANFTDVAMGAVLQLWPADPKPAWTAYTTTTLSASAYCICALMENTTSGNSSSNACAFVASGTYYCVRNQQ